MKMNEYTNIIKRLKEEGIDVKIKLLNEVVNQYEYEYIMSNLKELF